MRLLLILGAVLPASCTPTCEQAMAQKNHALAATQCERAFLKDHAPAHAIATIRALGLLGKDSEVGARAAWLEGTAYAPATHYYLALAARTSGDDAAATLELQACLADSPRAGLHDFAARCARQLASLQWTQGRFQEAFTHLQAALTEVRQTEDPILEGKIYGQLADLLAEAGDEAGEGRALDSVAERFKPIFPGGYAQVRLRQGLLELNRGHPNIAHDYFEQALMLSADAGLMPVVRAAHVNLAAVARSLHDLDGGQLHLAAAAQIPSQRSYENTTLSFAQAQLLTDLGRWQEAEASVKAALDAGAVADWQWQLKTLQGDCLEQLGNPGAARDAYQQATTTLDSLRAVALRPGLLAERRRPYEALFELHVQHADPRAALAVMEQLLAATFLEAMTAPQIPTTDLQASARRLATVERIATQQKGQAAVPLGQILARLGKRDVLAFMTARGHLYRARVFEGKIEIQPLQSVQEKREQLEAHPEDEAAAEALGRALWPDAPMAADVLIIPDASLATLSFAGLKFKGRYLVEDHVLSYAPGFGVAAILQDRALSGTGATILGDPKSDLPGAAAEAREAAHALDGTLFLGAAATVDRFNQGCKAQLLYVAAHSGVSADGAWLELADGTVTTSRVLEQRCRPSLVYLASCASAASARKDAAGTLAGAFLAAGSSFVVATTRSIDDASAARFARALFADGKYDSIPLRVAKAQRALLKTAPRAAWEPFIVLGP